SGRSSTYRPIRKKVPRTLCFARTSKSRKVCGSFGPSSKVSASRFAPRLSPTNVRPYHCPVGAIDWYPAALSAAATAAAALINVPSMLPIVNVDAEKQLGQQLTTCRSEHGHRETHF